MVKIHRKYIKILLKPVKKYGLATVLVFSLLLSPGSYLILAQEATQSARPERTTESVEAEPSVVPTPTNPPPPPAGGLTPTPTPTLTPTPTIQEAPTAVPSATLKPAFDKPSLDKVKLLKESFKAGEDVKVALGGFKLIDVRATLVSPDGQIVEVEMEEDEVDGERALMIKQPRSFKPGKYTLTVEDEVGNSVEQDFTWGVLAINTNKSIYLPNEAAKLSMAVLDDRGKMVCDASLKLGIRNTSEVKSLNTSEVKLSTEDETITVNPECQLHDFTLKPDYEAEYQVGEVGVYEMELRAETENGTYTITDSFEVRDFVPFDVERISATRIYPPKEYPVTFKIKVNEDFKGEVTEKVPSSFKVYGYGDSARRDTVRYPARIVERNTSDVTDTGLVTDERLASDENLIVWQVDWQKGETYELSYNFDAPDISPQFYLLGPLQFKSEILNPKSLPAVRQGETNSNFSNSNVPNEEIVFEEARLWEIASDTLAASTGTVDYTTTSFMTLAKDNLRADEPLEITVTKENPENLSERILGEEYDFEIRDPDGNLVETRMKKTGESAQTVTFRFAPPEEFRPGKYTFRYRRPAGSLLLQNEQEFTWGGLGDEAFDPDSHPLHSCEVTPFSSRLQAGEETELMVNFSPSESSPAFSYQVGDLPKGVTAAFGPINQAELSIPLSIKVAGEAQRGSFSIVVAYQEELGHHEVSNAICQFNLVVE